MRTYDHDCARCLGHSSSGRTSTAAAVAPGPRSSYRKRFKSSRLSRATSFTMRRSSGLAVGRSASVPPSRQSGRAQCGRRARASGDHVAQASAALPWRSLNRLKLAGQFCGSSTAPDVRRRAFRHVRLPSAKHALDTRARDANAPQEPLRPWYERPRSSSRLRPR